VTKSWHKQSRKIKNSAKEPLCG